MKIKTVLLCPNCGSADLYYENAMITGVVYHCKKCDYIGPVVIEEDLDEADIEQMKNSKKVVK
ncbi:MAG: hypothetical protein HPY73_06270 [Methanomassiliicoccales archaeon]|nr:MAG: hypothetical protein HPY73_06270 [Methanomassiliicoccales archaeon]